MSHHDGEEDTDVHALDVVALSETAWRVTDAGFARDAQGLLSYLEQVGDRVAVSIFSPPPRTEFVVDCFAAALRILRERGQSVPADSEEPAGSLRPQ